MKRKTTFYLSLRKDWKPETERTAMIGIKNRGAFDFGEQHLPGKADSACFVY